MLPVTSQCLRLRLSDTLLLLLPLLLLPLLLLLQEEGTPPEVVQQLEAKGHSTSVLRSYARSVFGKGTIITRDRDSGVLCGGCDARGDGTVMAW
jgi:gamma-glutamyltranspeptidase